MPNGKIIFLAANWQHRWLICCHKSNKISKVLNKNKIKTKTNEKGIFLRISKTKLIQKARFWQHKNVHAHGIRFWTVIFSNFPYKNTSGCASEESTAALAEHWKI